MADPTIPIDAPQSSSARIPGNPLIQRLLADEALLERVQTVISRHSYAQATQQDVDALVEAEQNYEDLSHLLLLSVNGSTAMKEQKVVVEYLKNDQRLLVPGALGMGIASLGRCRENATLRARYAKASAMPYAEIRALVMGSSTPGPIRQAVDTRVMPELTERALGWTLPLWRMDENGFEEDVHMVNTILGSFSHSLQFNCDIRDFGILNRNDMHVADDAWKATAATQFSRLDNKLYPYSLSCIAALNLPATGNCALASWVRAYGVGIGLLPSPTSRTVSEVRYVTALPTNDMKRTVIDYSARFELPMITLCCNLLAMFGLFHLNKDHTFRSNDANMDRIAESYINTLRTDTNAEVMTYIRQNIEALVRTAQHPFGLAQTYWLAIMMKKYDRLMSPLAVRVDTTPPPVQRLMICDAAAKEWDGMPAGKAVSALYVNELATIREEISRIRAEPAHFSALSRLYGFDDQEQVSEHVKKCVDAMMPAVFGYIVTTHTDERNERDGLGHALSLKNVERDMKGVVTTWKTAWEKYMTQLDQVGILDFVRQISVDRARDAEQSAGG